MTKTTYVDTERKINFINANLKGVNNLLAKLLDNKLAKSQTALTAIECNSKFINGIDMGDLKRMCRDEALYKNWLANIQQVALLAINTANQTKTMHCNNYLLMDSIDLVIKVISEGIAPALREDIARFREIGNSITSAWMSVFFLNEHSLLGDQDLLKITQIKKMANVLFRPIKVLCTIDYNSLFNQLKYLCDLVLHGGNSKLIFNLLIFISEIC